MLRDRQALLAPKLARHGLRIDFGALDDTGRQLVRPLASPNAVAQRLHSTLDELQARLQILQPAA